MMLKLQLLRLLRRTASAMSQTVGTSLCLLQVYTVTLHGEQLRTDFRIVNTDDKSFDFTAALHSYFEVLHVDQAQVCAGEQSVDSATGTYHDGLDHHFQHTQLHYSMLPI